MCRWAAYRGEPLYLEELVSSPAHSLIEQSHCATRAKTAVSYTHLTLPTTPYV